MIRSDRDHALFTRRPFHWRLTILLAVMSTAGASAEVPHVFVKDTPIVSREVNENFIALEDAIAQVDARVDAAATTTAPPPHFKRFSATSTIVGSDASDPPRQSVTGRSFALTVSQPSAFLRVTYTDTFVTRKNSGTAAGSTCRYYLQVDGLDCASFVTTRSQVGETDVTGPSTLIAYCAPDGGGSFNAAELVNVAVQAFGNDNDLECIAAGGVLEVIEVTQALNGQ